MRKLNEGEYLKLDAGETSASVANVSRIHGHRYLTFERHAWNFPQGMSRDVAIAIMACRLLPVFTMDGVPGRIRPENLCEAVLGGWINASNRYLTLTAKGLAVPFRLVENKQVGRTILSELEIGDAAALGEIKRGTVYAHRRVTGKAMVFLPGYVYRHPANVPDEIARVILAHRVFAPIVCSGYTGAHEKATGKQLRVNLRAATEGQWISIDRDNMIHLTPLGAAVPFRLRTDLSS